jgi:peptidoglycan lytic transglycosylase
MRLARRHLVAACALLAAGALALPSRAAADTATAGVPTGGTPAPTGGAAAPGDSDVVLRSSPGALVNRTTRLRGTVPSRLSGRTVTIAVYNANGTWTTVAKATADRAGNFSTSWRSRRSGRFTLRATVSGATARSGSSPGPDTGQTRVTVYPSAIATWYGPRGARAEQTACGVRLTKTTLGVAHRTLPCGTRVELYYRGRTITVPVIDRGPYANNASWDLTVATSDALNFTNVGLDRIGALVLRGRASS